MDSKASRAMIAIKKAQIAFAGAAELLGVKDDSDVQALVNNVRYNESNQ